MAHVATSLRLADAGADGVLSPLPPAELVGAGEPAEGALALVRARRSERRYQDEPLALGALSTVLADAAQPPLLSTAVRLHLLVRRVDGLAAGVHRYHPTSHALELVRPGDPSAAARSAALSQDVIGDAAVVIVLTADRDQVFARDGARGYRHTFLEMGMIGERLLLGATAKGWGACPVGAFYDDDMAKLLGVDLEREWVLHLVALGAL
jgi:SagB-type dehydrogenase family enzyme